MYEELKTALEETGIALAEGDWDRAPQTGSYLILRLEGDGDTVWGDNHMRQQAVAGSVHLYCRTKDRTEFETVQAVLDGLELSWRYNYTQYEPRNHIVHYEWLFELERM